jgi:hypothetical protein
MFKFEGGIETLCITEAFEECRYVDVLVPVISISLKFSCRSRITCIVDIYDMGPHL